MKKLAFLLAAICNLHVGAQSLKPGDIAPGFELKNIDQKKISLASYSDKRGVILIFTCNHCPFAKMYEDRIIALHDMYGKKGFPVIAINPNDPQSNDEDSFENMVKRAKEKKYSFPYLVDETQEVAKVYGAQRTPHVYLLSSKEGKFTVEFIGAIDDNAQEAKAVQTKYVENAIEAILKGKEVPTKSVKAVGCGIKWKS